MDQFKTPLNKPPPLRSSTATKRDSLAAELERDPQLSTSKRAHRTQLFTSSLSHSSLERQLLASQTAKVDLETKLREKELLVERLERDRAYFADREQEARTGMEEEREGREEDKRKHTSEIRTLRTSLSSVRDELADLQDTHSALSRSSSQTIAALKSQLSTLTHQNSLLQSELAESQSLAASRDSALQALQEDYDELLGSTEAQTRAQRDEESMHIVRDELLRQTEYLKKLESANSKMNSELRTLRAREKSVEVVREEKRDLERRVGGVEELRRRVGELEGERDRLRLKVSERERGDVSMGGAEDMDVNDPNSSTPIPLTLTLSSLRLAHAQLLDTHGTTLATLKSRESDLADVKAVNANLGREVKVLRGEAERLKEEKERVGRTLGVMEREGGFMRALVASYDAEQAMQSPTSETATLVDASRLDRIHELEAILQEYKDLNAELRSELEALGQRKAGEEEEDVKPVINKERIEELEKELEDLKEERDGLKDELSSTLQTLDTTEQTLFELQGEVAGGRHVPPGVRILSMADNPEEEWFRSRKEIIERLKGENEALRGRLRDVEEGMLSQNQSQSQSQNDEGANANDNANAPNSNSLIPPESFSSLLTDLSTLRLQLSQKEKRLQRLQEIFASKSKEFKDAIESVLGVKLAFYPNGGVRVTSVFDLYASFVFQPAPATAGATTDDDGLRTMQLIAQGEGGPEDVGGMMEYWIGKEQCIPGFMASVTLECWEKRRREGGR
ncbi:spindle assembly checkpoint component Mad1 [Panaeolus papilionaceus]|nr:spindle assembly checkpoint component Mad1 [Panaeolus papilionaceus]